jgi:hypothetical protein
VNGLSETELQDQIDNVLRIKQSLQTKLQNIEQDWAEKLKQKLDMDQLSGKLRGQTPELESLHVSIPQASISWKRWEFKGTFTHRCTVVGNPGGGPSGLWQILLRGVLGVVRKSVWGGHFYCIFMWKFFKIFIGCT